MNKGMLTSVTCEWETPIAFFKELDEKYHFTLDVCATPENAKCASFYTKEQDGLAQTWRGRCWMNPPYGRGIGAWIRKAYESVQNGDCELVCCLIPARTDTAWWHDYVMQGGVVTFVRGRLKFSGNTSNAPFPSAVCVFKRGILPNDNSTEDEDT